MAPPHNQCVICMQDLNDGQEVGAQLCGHVFHSECWKDCEDVKQDDFDIVVRDDVPCPICKMSAAMCQRTVAGTFDAAGGSGAPPPVDAAPPVDGVIAVDLCSGGPVAAVLRHLSMALSRCQMPFLRMFRHLSMLHHRSLLHLSLFRHLAMLQHRSLLHLTLFRHLSMLQHRSLLHLALFRHLPVTLKRCQAPFLRTFRHFSMFRMIQIPSRFSTRRIPKQIQLGSARRSLTHITLCAKH